ncbi:hypothetical protein Tco_0954868 [Tanacetum coccineum]|uniref:Uncharacterized protein n=1 Tax=Tanacetum coccineum TaxID=301880 RepID=A0ABQ5E5N6_9ASTR
MSQSIPEQLNVDKREFADAVNALTKFVFLKYQLKCGNKESSAICFRDLRKVQEYSLLPSLAQRYSTFIFHDIGLSNIGQSWRCLEISE